MGAITDYPLLTTLGYNAQVFNADGNSETVILRFD